MNDLFLVGFCVGLLAGVILFCFIDIVLVGEEEVIETLGTAICDQEYGLAFDKWSYSDDALKCKKAEQYDGLTVDLGGG